MTFEPTGDTCALLLVGVAIKCFWDGRSCATTSVTKCEKDGKAYVERLPESERGFEHLTKCEDMIVSRDCHSLLR